MTEISARQQEIVFGSGGVGRVVAVDCTMRRERRVEPVLCETLHLSRAPAAAARSATAGLDTRSRLETPATDSD